MLSDFIPKPKQTLRDYQNTCITNVVMSWEKRYPSSPLFPFAHYTRALVSLATGGGKTTIFSELLARYLNPAKQRALLMVHSEEIVEQIADRVTQQFKTLEKTYHVDGRIVPGIGIVKGRDNAANARIVVASRQTIQNPKRLEEVLSYGAFDYFIIDECHHYTQDNTYQQITWGIFKANPDVKLLGVTATPYRADKKPLGAGFDGNKPVFEWDILDGIEGGYLVTPVWLQVKTEVDLTSVKVNAEGEYRQKQSLSILEAHNWIDLTLDAFKKHLYGKRKHILCFLPSVEMSKQFVARLNAEGIKAAHVGDDTIKERSKKNPEEITRSEILLGLRAGELVVSNYGVFTEGVDAPEIDGILLARPTKNRGLLAQIIGRGLRLNGDKENCLILDIAVVDSRPKEKIDILSIMVTCKGCQAQVFRKTRVCPLCGKMVKDGSDPANQPPKEESDPSSEGGLKVVKPRSHIGEGLQEQIINWLTGSKSAWFKDDQDRFSLSLGKGKGSLVIMTPTNVDTTLDRERLAKGEQSLQIYHDDPVTKQVILNRMERISRNIARSEHYVLYLVPEDKGKIEQLRSNRDLSTLLAYADLQVSKLGDNSAFKTANWRDSEVLASQKQLDLLQRMRAPIPEGVPMSKGLASQMINHYLSLRPVKQWIADDYVSQGKVAKAS